MTPAQQASRLLLQAGGWFGFDFDGRPVASPPWREFFTWQREVEALTATMATATLAEDVLSAAAALDIDHETVVPSGGEDHDGPAASEGEPKHDSGGPL